MAKRKWKKVQVVEGWIGKREKTPINKHRKYDHYTTDIYTQKSTVIDWGKDNYPPKRVRITVEVDDGMV